MFAPQTLGLTPPSRMPLGMGEEAWLLPPRSELNTKILGTQVPRAASLSGLFAQRFPLGEAAEFPTPALPL